jgi:hypothetical protein
MGGSRVSGLLASLFVKASSTMAEARQDTRLKQIDKARRSIRREIATGLPTGNGQAPACIVESHRPACRVGCL